MAVCGVKVGKIKLFWKHWTKSDHKHLTTNLMSGKLGKLGFLDYYELILLLMVQETVWLMVNHKLIPFPI